MYVGRNQHGSRRRRPWELLPEPIVNAALRAWGIVPAPLRRALRPLADLINPHTTTGVTMPGASSVPGVDERRAEGFTPIEELTGFVEVAMVWPEDDRRSVPETREWWLEEPLDGQVWLVRPPWAGWTMDEVLVFLWSLVDDYRERDQRLQAASAALRWPGGEGACATAEGPGRVGVTAVTTSPS